MITIEYLTELGKGFVSHGSLSSPMMLIEYGKGRGLIPISDLAPESNPQALYELGFQAGRNERQTGRVQQVAVLAEGRIASRESGLSASISPDGQQVLIIDSWVRGSGTEHVIYQLEHQENGRAELSTIDPQPERIVSPVLEEFIRGYEDGQAALKRELDKALEL
jgi:hypothetical protein